MCMEVLGKGYVLITHVQQQLKVFPTFRSDKH